MQTRHLDAGDERERLARELANWKAAGFKNPAWARGWHHRVRRLARLAGMPIREMRTSLDADAEILLAE